LVKTSTLNCLKPLFGVCFKLQFKTSLELEFNPMKKSPTVCWHTMWTTTMTTMYSVKHE